MLRPLCLLHINLINQMAGQTNAEDLKKRKEFNSSAPAKTVYTTTVETSRVILFYVFSGLLELCYIQKSSESGI